MLAWAYLNDMALNTSKTKSILITTQQKFHRLNDHSLDVMINGKLIEQVQHARLLGVTLDCLLTWEKHIENKLCSIVNSRLSLLRSKMIRQKRSKFWLLRMCEKQKRCLITSDYLENMSFFLEKLVFSHSYTD